LETNIRDRITWTFNQNELWTATDTSNGTVIMTKIMVLSLPASAVISGAWVFDEVIVVRFATTNKLLIYQKPLVAGGTKFPL
jgi:hypothetical protein